MSHNKHRRHQKAMGDQVSRRVFWSPRCHCICLLSTLSFLSPSSRLSAQENGPDMAAAPYAWVSGSLGPWVLLTSSECELSHPEPGTGDGTTRPAGHCAILRPPQGGGLAVCAWRDAMCWKGVQLSGGMKESHTGGGESRSRPGPGLLSQLCTIRRALGWLTPLYPPHRGARPHSQPHPLRVRASLTGPPWGQGSPPASPGPQHVLANTDPGGRHARQTPADRAASPEHSGSPGSLRRHRCWVLRGSSGPTAGPPGLHRGQGRLTGRQAVSRERLVLYGWEIT